MHTSNRREVPGATAAGSKACRITPLACLR